MTLGQRLKLKRTQAKLTQKDLAAKLGIDHTTISKWESDIYEPDASTLNKLADLFDVSVDWITGRTDDPTPYAITAADLVEGKRAKVPVEREEPYYTLTEKDERDIAKKLDALLNELDGDSALSFLGEPMSEEDRELLRISLENTVRLSKEMAKKKFTPKKYRN